MLNKDLNKDLKPYWIRDFIKYKLRYSFKRGSSRNKKAKSSTSIYAQAAFSSKLMRRILEDRLIVNIDESSFGRSIRNNYSWLPKSLNSGIINKKWSGRLTLIWGLTSNGSWMCMSINQTAKTEHFGIFMLIFRAYVDKCFNTKSKVITAAVDNAAIHLTKQSKALWIGLGIELLGLPQFCPHHAPWELVFGMVKGILKRRFKYKGVDFSKIEGKSAVVKALEKLDTKKALNMWKVLLKYVKPWR